jgi:hypothetical protein
VRALLERIGCDCLAQVTDCCAPVSRCKRRRRQPLQSLQIGLLPALALLQYPLLGTPLQQWALVERDGSLQRGKVSSVDLLVEGEHVHGHPIEIQGEGLGRRRAKSASIGTEGGTQVGEGTPEAAEGLGLGEVRPESAGEPRTFYLARMTEDQERKQPVALAGADAGERLSVPEYVEGTEKLDGHLRCATVGHVTLPKRQASAARDDSARRTVLGAVTVFLAPRDGVVTAARLESSHAAGGKAQGDRQAEPFARSEEGLRRADACLGRRSTRP